MEKIITISAVNAWNKIQTAFGNVILKNLTTTQIKTLLTKKCIEKYWQIIHLILTGRLNYQFIIIIMVVVIVRHWWELSGMVEFSDIWWYYADNGTFQTLSVQIMSDYVTGFISDVTWPMMS